MKARILKKIRKRFSYYYKMNGDTVILDNRKKISIVINDDYLANFYGKTVKEVAEFECGIAELKRRHFLRKILLSVGVAWRFDERQYSIYKRRQSILAKKGRVRNEKKQDEEQ